MVPTFKFKSDFKFLDEIVQYLETKLSHPEEYLIKKGDKSDYIYFILSGTVLIFLNDPLFGKVKGDFFKADEGSIFGEIGVILDTKRTANAITENYSVFT